MTLTQKETSLLQDMKSQEELCIEKYSKYEAEACDPALKSLFSSIKATEQSHLDTVNRIMNGEEVATAKAPSAVSEKLACTPSGCPADKKNKDAFLAKDALTMEKHVSSLYDTCIFEFTSPVLRDTLNHIQNREKRR